MPAPALRQARPQKKRRAAKRGGDFLTGKTAALLPVEEYRSRWARGLQSRQKCWEINIVSGKRLGRRMLGVNRLSPALENRIPSEPVG
jgi:hypothetical protein